MVAIYLALALVLGGGGSPNPWSELLLQLGGAALFARWLVARRTAAQPIPTELRWLAALVLVVPLLQLLPLPPSVWQALPARDLVRDSLALVGAEDTWRPLSVAPRLTLASLLSAIPPVVLMLAAAQLDRRGVRRCLLVVAGAALASALLGAVQLASGQGYLYPETHRGWITGVFANRNAAVDLFLVGSLAAAAWIAGATQPRRWTAWHWAVQAVLLLATVLTGSRMGIALLVLVAAFHMALHKGKPTLSRRSAALIGATVVASVAALLQMPRFAPVAARFAESWGFRTELWPDAWAAAQAFWPVGSGLGTFTRAFTPFERLEAVDATVANRAHNDYLELLIEAGVFAPLVLGLAAFLLVRLARRSNALSREHQLFALGVLGLHATVDYPLRTMALASLAALAAGVLASRTEQRQKQGEDGW